MPFDRIGRALALATAASLAGCAYGHYERDRDRAPRRDTGAGASIILPGQSPPPVWDPSEQGWQSSPGSTQGRSAGGPAGAGDPGAAQPGTVARPRITSIGGSEEEEQRSQKIQEAPIWNKYLVAPFAVLAYPFVKTKELIQGEPEPGPPIPAKNEARTLHPAELQRRNEQARLQALEDQRTQRLEQELEQRRQPAPQTSAGSAPGGTVPYRYERAPSPPTPGGGALPLSIAEELEALRGRRLQGAGPAPPPPAPLPGAGASTVPPHPARPPVWPQARPPAPGEPSASLERPLAGRATAPGSARPAPRAQRWDQTLDRDGDGVPDQWIDRSAGQRTREAFDDDGDGVPERTVYYDPASGQPLRVEQDNDGDGRPDAWSQYRDGELVEQEADSNHDGSPDNWGFYRGGELVRLEADTSGDGFRDRVRYFRGGRLVRETQDRDGDGYPEATLHYDENEELERRDEDLDGDGRVDVTSHYEAGRLARRELLSEVARDPDADGGTPGR